MKKMSNNTRKQLQGKVIGNKMDKTVKVQVENPVRHPVYHKVISERSTFFAHTEEEVELDSLVVIEECKPYSKNVKWKVIEVK